MTQQKIPNDFKAEKEFPKEDIKEVVIKKSLSYQVSSGLKEEIYEMIFSKTADQVTLRKWVEGWLPQIRASADLTSSNKFKDALKKGVPIEVRGEVWEHFLGNDLKVNDSLY